MNSQIYLILQNETICGWSKTKQMAEQAIQILGKELEEKRKTEKAGKSLVRMEYVPCTDDQSGKVMIVEQSLGYLINGSEWAKYTLTYKPSDQYPVEEEREEESEDESDSEDDYSQITESEYFDETSDDETSDETSYEIVRIDDGSDDEESLEDVFAEIEERLSRCVERVIRYFN